MEPAGDRPDDGSLNLSRLTCVNGAVCERFVFLRSEVTCYGVVKVRKHRLTCVRALPGVRLATSALARPTTPVTPARIASHNDRALRRQFLMLPQKQEA